MNYVQQNLYIGDSKDASNLPELRKAKITAIVNVAADLNDPYYDWREFKAFKVALTDGEGIRAVLAYHSGGRANF